MSARWHGWGRGATALHIGLLPGRKRPMLYLVEGSVVTPLASFGGPDEADRALRILDDFIPSASPTPARDAGTPTGPGAAPPAPTGGDK